jgi:hypothetical protein
LFIPPVASLRERSMRSSRILPGWWGRFPQGSVRGFSIMPCSHKRVDRFDPGRWMTALRSIPCFPRSLPASDRYRRGGLSALLLILIRLGGRGCPFSLWRPLLPFPWVGAFLGDRCRCPFPPSSGRSVKDPFACDDPCLASIFSPSLVEDPVACCPWAVFSLADGVFLLGGSMGTARFSFGA